MKLPFFILGNPRSGTSLLRVLLNSHDQLVVPPEAGFLVWLYPKYGDFFFEENNVRQFIRDLFATRKFETWNLDEEKLIFYILNEQPQNYASLCSLVYRFYGSMREKQVSIWGDKNNFYIDYIATISSIYPEALFIHIVRDGRDVACSYRELGKKKIDSKYAPKLPSAIAEIAADWKRNNEKIETQTPPDRRYLVLYEDLVQAPLNTLNRLFSFLGLKRVASLETNAPRLAIDEPTEFLQWKEKLTQPLNFSSIGRFKEELNKEDIRLFEGVVGNTLHKYHYE